MSDNFFRKKLFFLGFLIPAVFCAQAVLAGNPTTFISPTNNVIDPGSTSTPWGGCGPSDSNCYIQSKTVAVTKLAETKNLDTIQKIVSSNSNTATSPTVTSQALLSALRSLFAGPLPNDILLKLRGPAGPVGPKGDSSVQSSSSGYTPIPSSFAIVGTIQPNPATNFAGATLFSVTDLSSSNFTTTTANTTTLNVTGDSNLTGNLNVAGNITVNTVNGGSVLTSLSGAVMTDQTTPQTIGTSANRLTKLWVTDLDVANTITGNLNGNATTANAATTVTTNANLTGPITSVGNATSVASQTGTGNTFVMNTSPTLITPTIASLIGNKIYPASDSTTAIQINKADGTTNVFNVDTTNGRVGIGTIPQSALDVNGDIRIHAGSGGQIVFADGSTMSSAGLGSAAALSNSTDAIITGDSDSNGSGEVILKTGSNDRLHILNGGNIGIGTPTPATTLDINGITTFRGNIIAGTDNTYDIGASGATRPRTGYFGTSVVAPSFVGNLIGSKIYPASDSTTAIQINKADGTTNVFNVDTTNGRVGIGTTTPTQLLSLTSTTGTAAENFTSEVTTAGNTGATYVTSGTDNAGTGTVAWTTPGNITASDGNYATATPSSGNPTHYLQGTGLGFSVPSNATITGVMLEINDFTSGKGVPIITDNVVSLVKNGTVSGNNEASGSIWNTGPATAVYGSSSDMWGLTLTPADVNASNFGAVISTQNSSGVSRTVSVDFMRITVYYTIPSETWIAGNNSVNANFQISQNSSFGTNDYLSINPAGNVGIGTTTPRTTLEVRSKSGNASNTFFTTNDFVPSSTGSKLLVGFGAASGNTYSELGATSNGGNSWNNLILQSGGGNVGIGTTTPNSTLDVSGNVNIHGSSISQLTMYDQDSLDTFDAIDTGLGDHALNLDGFGGWGKVMVGSFNRSAVSNLVVNGEVGIGTATPSFPMQILSTTNPQLAISYDDSNNSTLGVDASGILTINPTGGVVNIGNPNGTSDNELRIYGYSSSDNYLSLTHTGTDALIDASFGTNWIRIGNEATDLTGGVLLFGNSSSGENREFRVYGYNTNTATANYGSLNYSDTYGGLVIKTDVGQVQIGTGAATTLPSPTSNDLFVSGRLQIAGNTSVGLTGGFSDAPVALSNPATLPPATTTGTAFSPDGTYLAVTSNLSPYLIIYKRSGDTFTKLADPATLPDHIKGGTAFSPDGTYLAVTSSNSPYILMYKRSGDTFTKIADPVTLPSSPKGTAFSPDGTYLAVTSNSSPFIIIYKGSGGAIHQEELALNSTASGGLGISKELSLYRSAPGILTLADGGSFNIPTGNLTVGSNLGIGTTSPAANLDVESTAVAGNITNISAPSAVTALGSITGLNVNLSTNYTATGQNVTGGTITLPAVTNTGTAIYAYQGLGITGNALVQNTGAGTDTWNGLAVTMPNITQTTGTVTSTGINITGGTVTSGKSYALISDANSGNVGIATATPGQRLTVGYDGNSALEYSQLSTGNMALSQLEGGAYFGRVGLKENQWGLNNYATTWTQLDSNARAYDGIAMSSDGKIETAVVLSGASKGIYNSTNYGVTWTQVDSSSFYESIAMSSDGKIETAGTSGLNGGVGIYNSTNYGVTWTQVDSNSRAYSGIAMSSDGKIETTVVSSGEIYGSEASSTTLGNIGIGTTSPTHLLDVAGNSDITGYLRVGSTSNPVNTTAGDLTARRLSINNGTLGVGTQAELAVFGDNMSDTSGTIGLVNMTGTLNPASDSSASSRTLTMSMQYNTASNFSGTSSSGQNAGWFETRVINAGNIAQTTGGYFAGLIAGSTATTLGTVTDVDAGMFQAVSSFSNALTSTITRARGVHVINSGNFGTGPLTITSQIGIGVDALSGAANNTHLLLGQATAPTGNYGIYDASSSNNYFNGNVGIGTTTPAGMLDVSKALSETPSATVGAYISLSASTLTDNATVGSGTATGAVFNSIAAPTLAATNSSVTTTNAYNLYLGGAPKSSSNETLTNTTALYIAAAAVKPSGAVTNSYGLQVNAQTGATNNYSAIFSGGNVGIGTTSPIYPLQVNGNLGLTSSRNFIIDLAPPGTPSVTPSTSGGSMADGSYFYVVTAVDFNAGTTVQSTQSSVATISGGGGAGSVALSWTGVTGAKSYNVYRTTTSGTYGATSLIANVTPTLSTPGTITYTDVAASTSSGTPPSSTTANAIRLSSTGGTSWLTGAFDLIGNSGTNRDIVTQSNGLNRWIIRTTGTAESGSDVGSDLQFIARHDDGSSSFNVLTFKRSNGFIAINNSTTGTQILNINNGNLQFTYAGPPGAPTVALAGLGAGNLTNGIYSYRVTYVNAGGGESSRGSASSNVTVTDATTNGQIALTNIPTSGDAQIVKRNIYRTISGGANWLLLTTINDNTTTTYTDNIADSSLGATAAPTISTIAGGIYAGSTDAIQISATGTVGILTSPTTAALSVNGQSDLLHGNVRVGDNGSGTNFGLVLTAKDASAQGWMADITGLTQLGAGSTVGTTPYISIINTAGSTQGNVGIGTTVPGDRLEVANTSTLASESLTNGNLTSGTSWTQTGDMALTSNAATYTNSSGTGTLNQASGTLAIAGNPNRLYSFTYTISGISGTAPVATITTSFAATAQTLTTNATGTFTLIFRSAASPGNFVISVTSGAAGAFTIDTLSLKEVTGGNAIVDGLITGGGTAGIKIDGSGNVTIGANQNLTMSSGTGLFSQTYNGTTGNVGSISLSAASQTTDTGLNITQSGATITSYTGNIATIVGAFSGASSTGNLLNLTTVADAAGSALNITANSLTTGKTLSIASSATGLTTAGTNVGSLIDVTESGIMTGFTGSLVNINASGATNAVGDTGTALNINLAGTAQIMKAIVITDATVAGTTDMITMKYSGLVNTSVTSTNKFLRFIDSGNSTLGQISGNSSSSVGVLYTASSDQRIKHDITNTHFSLDDLMKLQVRDYVFNGDPTNTIQTGFIAQELDTIYPEAVATNGDNGIVPLAPDAIPWGVDYGKITPLIVKAIQDLDLKLTDLSNNPIINPSTTIGQYASMFFGDVIEKIDSGVAYMKALVIDTLKVGSPTKPTGITLYDQVTGAPYCLSIENGVTKTAPGECVAVEISNTSNASGNANLDSGGSSSTGSTNSTQTNSDTIPPVITLNGESTLNLNVGDTYTEQGAIATDNVDTSVAIIISGAVDTSTAGTYTITYTAKDTAGNSAIPVIRTVNVGNVSTAPNTTTPTSAATSDTTTDTSSTTDTTTPATP